MADRFGRKRTIQVGASVAILGCALQAGARNISCQYIAEFHVFGN